MTDIGWQEGQWTNLPAQTTELAGGALSVVAKEGSDAWRQTYYGFTHASEHALLAPWEGAGGMEVSFLLDYQEQFDQAGVFVRAAKDVWIKAGVEFADGIAQLGAVVTHGQSDWSLAPVPSWQGQVVTVGITRHEDAVVIRARAGEEPDRLVRVAHMPRSASLEAGPHLAAPSRSGLTVRFDAWRKTGPERGIH